MLSPLIQQLIEAFSHLPGIGPKSAQRLAFQLLSQQGQPKGLVLSEVLKKAIEKVGHCQRCRIYTEETLCNLCKSPKRNASLLCIVENPADVAALEQTHIFSGLYFVLQGHLSPLDGMGPSEIGLPHLFERLKQEPVEEIIIATNSTMEGEATAHYIANHIDRTKIHCSRIAHGIPMGGELGYLDGGTLGIALQFRTKMSLT